MFVTEGVYTRKVASIVGSGIKYLIEHPEDDRYMELELARERPKASSEKFTVSIKLIDDIQARVVTLANGHEIVRCITNDGRHLDIMFGNSAERELEPALVLIEELS